MEHHTARVRTLPSVGALDWWDLRLMNRLRCVILVWSALCGAIGVGCAGQRAASPVAPSAAPAPIDPLISAAAFGEPEGLEIRWWILRHDSELIVSTLEPYLNQPLPVDDATTQRLRECGLRLVAIPMADLTGLRTRLPLVGRIDRRWIGQTASWVEGVSGPRFRGSRTVRLGMERLSLPSGVLRLLTRVWKDPGVSAGRLRIDLAIQHVDAATLDPHQSALEFGSAGGPLVEGMIFSSTLTEMIAGETYFYLLVPELPEREWAPEDDDEDEQADASSSPNDDWDEPAPWSPEPIVEETLVQGPPAAGLPTLGELMLMQPEDPVTGRLLRAVIVLVPRVREGQSLLP